MKILKHGTHTKKTYQISCACGCVFQFQKNDPMIQQKGKDYFIICPDCNNEFHHLQGMQRWNEND